MLLLLLSGCTTGRGPSPQSATRPSTPLGNQPPARASASSAASTAPASPPPAAATAPTHRDCGELGCKAFGSAEAAFAFVLADAPRVLAIGEAHAQSASPASASSTRRFMDKLLPQLAPRASDLVIELWVANGSCGKVEQKVEQQQRAVTAPQAATNQNEFLELGHRAKALGIQPHALVPTCEQYQKISGAGAADIEEMLRMIKSVTQRDVEELLLKRAPDRLIVAYGGAMHNDLAPRPGREDFAFGPELSQRTSGHYVELDLVIPEQIRDTEAWRALPWYAQYSREKAGSDALLYSWAPHAYALLFPPAIAAPSPP